MQNKIYWNRNQQRKHQLFCRKNTKLICLQTAINCWNENWKFLGKFIFVCFFKLLYWTNEVVGKFLRIQFKIQVEPFLKNLQDWAIRLSKIIQNWGAFFFISSSPCLPRFLSIKLSFPISWVLFETINQVPSRKSPKRKSIF
jgi:hypothetical protein